MSTTVATTGEVAAAAAPHLRSWLDHQRRRLRVPGVQVAVRVGDRLVLLHPSAPEPTEEYAELTVQEPGTLRLETVAGFGSPGETVQYEWATDGTVSRVRIGGISAWPLEVFRSQRAAQVTG